MTPPRKFAVGFAILTAVFLVGKIVALQIEIDHTRLMIDNVTALNHEFALRAAASESELRDCTRRIRERSL